MTQTNHPPIFSGRFTFQVEAHLNNINIEQSTENIIHPAYFKYFNRSATQDEIDEAINLIVNQSYNEQEFDIFIYNKFDLLVEEVFHKAWDMCDTCFYFYVREKTAV